MSEAVSEAVAVSEAAAVSEPVSEAVACVMIRPWNWVKCRSCSSAADVKFDCRNKSSYCYRCYEKLEKCYVCHPGAGCKMPFTEYTQESEAEEKEFQMEVEQQRRILKSMEAEAVLELRRQRSVRRNEAVLDQWSDNLKSCIAQAGSAIDRRRANSVSSGDNNFSERLCLTLISNPVSRRLRSAIDRQQLSSECCEVKN